MGGNAFEKAGTIYIDEIMPTLSAISSLINIDVTNNVLGSVGKKHYSGDIDIVLNLSKAEQKDFIKKLRNTYTDVRNMGVLSALVPIKNYNSAKLERLPRTGFVQVDFMFGEVNWNKFYYHSPHESQSAFKGTHRNIALSSVCRWIETTESEELDEYDRPVSVVRWKWSPRDGLCKVRRTSRISKHTGRCIKKQDEELLGSAITDKHKITSTLFNNCNDPELLDSLESIITLLNNPDHFNQALLPKVYQTMADNFSKHHLLKLGDYSYPKEIAQYQKPDK